MNIIFYDGFCVQGPNYLWHVDGYDKLKPYGFCIHGCIDGFSRRIIWLDVGTTNNDPSIVAYYYLQSIEQLQGTPAIIRGDLGTENSTLAFIQPFLRRHGTDSAQQTSFRYGRSVSNQRIEAWWGILRKWNSDWWIDFFKNLKAGGHFDETNPVDIDCLRFAFMHIIKKEIEQVALEWNNHSIRHSSYAVVPNGSPEELFFMPSILGPENYLQPVDNDDLLYVQRYAVEPGPPASYEFLMAADILMSENNLRMPTSVEEALDFYIKLKCLLNAEVF